MAGQSMAALLREMEQYATERHVPILRASGRAAFCHAVAEARPKRILEVGTAIGYSALLLAQHGAPGAQVTTLERSEERAEAARQFIARSPFAAQIRILTGDAGKILTELSGPFDFVFLDAAKGQYVDYFHKVQPLLARGAVIAADNVLFRGYVRAQERAPRRYRTIVKRLREYIGLVQAPGFVTEIHEDGDGLAVTRRVRKAIAKHKEA